MGSWVGPLVTSAREMLEACEKALPVDVAVCAAAVCDWRPARPAPDKIKKAEGAAAPVLELAENPDILCGLARRERARPRLVIGFAAETEALVAHAREKRRRKGCDWILANDVGAGTGVLGGDRNRIVLLRDEEDAESWPEMDKREVARRLVAEIARALAREDGR